MERRELLPRPRVEKRRLAASLAKLERVHLDRWGHLPEPHVPLRSIERDDWTPHIDANYPLASGFIGNEYGPFSRWDPLITIEAIEGRALTAEEELWYGSSWRWELPIARCQLWLELLPRMEDDIPDQPEPEWLMCPDVM